MQEAAYPDGAPVDEKPTSDALRQAIRNALQEGCGKGNNVYIYGPRTAAKSHCFLPLKTIFAKDCFIRMVGKNNFPLQNLPGKQVVFLDDLRYSTLGLSFDALLVWFQGDCFTVSRPRNVYKEDALCEGWAPVFATAGKKMRIPLRGALELQLDPQEQNEMMDHRFRYFCFLHKFDDCAV